MNKTEFSLFYHFVGSCPGSVDYEHFLRRLLFHLAEEESQEKDTETLATFLHGLLASKTVRPTIILIAAVNQVSSPLSSLSPVLR